MIAIFFLLEKDCIDRRKTGCTLQLQEDATFVPDIRCTFGIKADSPYGNIKNKKAG
ncbi:MAG TPA: hypothetical protein VM571_13420 [Noviherbaspirillum sp.]|nr:hypothetical protein [Noviherbaspirillum sp.]